jgi:alpha-L-rhamnosidase
VKYSNQTSYGKAGIQWSKQGEQLNMQIDVPVGSSATVYVPVLNGKSVMESGLPVAESIDVKFLKEEDGYRVFSVASGKYSFTSK